MNTTTLRLLALTIAAGALLAGCGGAKSHGAGGAASQHAEAAAAALPDTALLATADVAVVAKTDLAAGVPVSGNLAQGTRARALYAWRDSPGAGAPGTANIRPAAAD